MNPVWESRTRRAAILADAVPDVAPTLRFYRAITTFQQDLHHRLETRPRPDRQAADLGFLCGFFVPLLEMVEHAAPAKIARQALRFRERPESDWEKILRRTWKSPSESAAEFFPNVLLHPQMMLLADEWRREVGALESTDGSCPFCNRPPVAAVDESGGFRLVCSFCATEWSYPRHRCPRCHETSVDRQARFSMGYFPWIQVSTCQSCQGYLKVIDLHQRGDAVAVVDEIASPRLDDFAREKGYSKLVLNLVGV